jgi:hypothetical protein
MTAEKPIPAMACWTSRRTGKTMPHRRYRNEI